MADWEFVLIIVISARKYLMQKVTLGVYIKMYMC